MLLYHCTKNEAEFAEVVSILGNSRKFKIGHLRLDVKLGRTEGLTIEEMAKKKGWLLLCCCWRKFSKTRKKKTASWLFNRVSFPVCTEIVYIQIGDVFFTGKQFDEIGAAKFVER